MHNYCRNEKCKKFIKDAIITFQSEKENIDTLFVLYSPFLSSDSSFIADIYTSKIKLLCESIGKDVSTVGYAYQYPCSIKGFKSGELLACVKSNLQLVIDNVPGIDKIVCFGVNSLKYFTNKKKSFQDIGRVFYSTKCPNIPVFSALDPLVKPNEYIIDFLPAWKEREIGANRSLRQFLRSGPNLIGRNYNIIYTIDKLKEVVDKIKDPYRVSFDFETTGLRHDSIPLGLGLHDVITDIAFYIPLFITPFESGKKDYTPFFSPEDHQEMLSILWEFLERCQYLTAQNATFDFDFLMQIFGSKYPKLPKYGDSQLLKHMWSTHSLSRSLSNENVFHPEHVGYEFARQSEVNKDDGHYAAEEVTVETTANYCMGDVSLTSKRDIFYISKLNQQQQILYQELLQKAIRVYGFAKNHGIKIDVNYINDGIDRVKNDMKKSLDRFTDRFGFKPSQTKKLAELFFKDMGLESVKKTKTGESVDKYVLEALRREYPENDDLLDILDMIEDVNFHSHLLSDNLNGVLKEKTDEDRIHATFNLHVPETFRRSCSGPNLQNLPKRDERKVWVRGVYVPDHPDFVFNERDLNAVEMYVLGFQAGDPILIDALERNISPHAVSACGAFNFDLETFDKREHKRKYDIAKEINFANVFGAGFKTLLASINKGLPQKERVSAQDLQIFLNNWRKKHHRIVEYKEEELEKIKRNGFVNTPFGIIRPMNKGRGNPNTLFNTIMQSSSGLMILMAIILTFEELEQQNALDEFIFCMDIHDAMIFQHDAKYTNQFDDLAIAKTHYAAQYIGMPKIGSEGDIYPNRFGIKE